MALENDEVKEMDITENVEEKDTTEFQRDRMIWTNKAEFILANLANAVGLGNVWRFPYMAYENGGAAFLIPYTITMICAGIPLYILEATMGQFMQKGTRGYAKLSPFGKNLSISMVLVSVNIAIYYNIVLSYAVFYMFSSFQLTLPWNTCDESWGANASTCYIMGKNFSTVCFGNQTSNCTVGENSSKQYWRRNVINEHPEGLETFGDLGIINWKLAVYTLLLWIVIYISLMRGVKTSGKVVYLVALGPYVVLFIMLIASFTVKGSGIGLKYLFVPAFVRILEPRVWRKAVEQVFFSLGVSWGTVTTFGSYNKFRHRTIIKEMIIVCFADMGTSIIAGIVIFSVLGSWATQLKVNVEDVLHAGTGLAFIIYPSALNILPFPPFWCAIFFFMLILLGLGSQFGLVENILTYVHDTFKTINKYRYLTTALLCLLGYLFGLILITRKGTYVVEIMDRYGAIPIFLVGFFQIITVAWIYGYKKYFRDLNFMISLKWQKYYWKPMLSFIAPIVMIIVFIYGLSQIERTRYSDEIKGETYYPIYADIIGLLLVMGLIGPVIFGNIFNFFWLYRKDKKWTALFKTFEDWGPGDLNEYHVYRKQYFPESKNEETL